MGPMALSSRLPNNRQIVDGVHVTRDLGGTASTDEFTDAVVAKLQTSAPALATAR